MKEYEKTGQKMKEYEKKGQEMNVLEKKEPKNAKVQEKKGSTSMRWKVENNWTGWKKRAKNNTWHEKIEKNWIARNKKLIRKMEKGWLEEWTA